MLGAFFTFIDGLTWRDAVFGPQERPRRVHVRVQVLLRGLPVGGAVAGVVVAEDVAVDAGAWEKEGRSTLKKKSEFPFNLFVKKYNILVK